MAKGKLKKRLEFRDYDHAMKAAQALSHEGKQDTEDYEVAMEAATQFFLRVHSERFFNPGNSKVEYLTNEKINHNVMTLKDLLRSIGVKQENYP